MSFKNRTEAGKLLAEKLSAHKDDKNTIVYGLTKGGVIVAAAVAEELGLPLDCIIARKISRYSPNLAEGALAEDDEIPVFYTRLLASEDFRDQIREARATIAHQQKIFRQGRQIISPEGKTCILIDDGIAMGMTMLAATNFVKKRRAESIAVAVPVALSGAGVIDRVVGEKIWLYKSDRRWDFIGKHYESFEDVSEAEVIDALAKYRPSV